MADDKHFFRGMSYVHPRYRVPSKALIGQAIWSCLLCLTGTYQDLYEFVVFALVIFFGATGLGRHHPAPQAASSRPSLSDLGDPVVPILFALVNLLIFIKTVVSEPRKSLLGLLLLAVGIPAYFYWRRKSNAEDALEKEASR